MTNFSLDSRLGVMSPMAMSKNMASERYYIFDIVGQGGVVRVICNFITMVLNNTNKKL